MRKQSNQPNQSNEANKIFFDTAEEQQKKTFGIIVGPPGTPQSAQVIIRAIDRKKSILEVEVTKGSEKQLAKLTANGTAPLVSIFPLGKEKVQHTPRSFHVRGTRHVFQF